MVSHKNSNLIANESFVTFMTSKLITCFIEDFTLKRKSHSIAYLFNRSEHIYIYIGFWTLKMKCSQHGLYEQATFENAKAIFIFEIGRSGQRYLVRLQLKLVFLHGCPEAQDRGPQLLSTSPWKFIRGRVSTLCSNFMLLTYNIILWCWSWQLQHSTIWAKQFFLKTLTWAGDIKLVLAVTEFDVNLVHLNVHVEIFPHKYVGPHNHSWIQLWHIPLQ